MTPGERSSGCGPDSRLEKGPPCFRTDCSRGLHMGGQETRLPKVERGTPRKVGLQGQALQSGRKGDTPSREDGLCMAK